MEPLWIEQRSVIGTISRFLDNVKKLGKNNYTAAILKNRMVLLKDYWKDCQRLNAQIEAAATKSEQETHDYFVNTLFLEAEDNFVATTDYIASWIDKLTKPLATIDNPREGSTSEQPHMSIQLPRIMLPKFSGNYTDWENFKDIFESLVVNNETLSNVQRLHYLKASLVDDAKLILKNVSVTEANYNSAWEMLKQRYDNQRIIINAHLQSFIELPSMNSSSVKELRSLRDKTIDALTALKNLKRPVDQWDDVIVYILVNKLDKLTRKEWEFKLGDQTTNPTFKDLDSFLSAHIRALEAVSPADTGSSTNSKTDKNKSTKTKEVNAHQTNSDSQKCTLCKQNHFLYQCKDFKDKSIEQRYDFLKTHKRCFNCLNSGHFPSTCYSKHVCKVCKGKHHSLLHKKGTNTARSSGNEPPEHNNSNSSENTSEINSHFTKHDDNLESVEHTDVSAILLPTAFVLLRSDSGRSIKVRALLDQGSQATFISESIAQYLKARRARVSVSVTGVGGASVGCARSAAAVTLESCDQDKPGMPIRALVLPKLTSYIPKISQVDCSWPHLANLKLADPHLSSSAPIELLIGADFYGRILLSGVQHGPVGSPTAQLTLFGWVVSGPVASSSESMSLSLVAHFQHMDEFLDESLRNFWELEEIPTKSTLTEEESACETHFQQTHGRESDGRYVVRLPFKTGPPIQIGESKAIASRIFSRNEAKLRKQPELALQYREFMYEYETLHHMEKVDHDPASGLSEQIVYFPHHPVLRETSQTTKLRVVFNASCATSNGFSLNDFLHVGPKLQADLFALILRWRAYPYVYTADIEKMFRQIKIHPVDGDYQRIVWRSDPNDVLSSYRLLTVTYGTACAPFLANRVLKQLAKDVGDEFPLAVPILENCTYVDDIMFGAEDIVLAKQIRNQLTQLLKAGGFNPRKWASNTASLLDDIPAENHGLATDKSLTVNEGLKVLGTVWNPCTDSFRFSVDIGGYPEFTKRLFLSLVSRIFDPQGWASPFTITAKIILQILWIRKINWDEKLPTDLAQKCLSYQSQLPLLQKITIPRWTGQHDALQQYQIHGFADASNAAYAAVVYLRVESLDGTVKVSPFLAKTKVAPLKVQSIPRLELCAAVLLSRLIHFTQTTMQLLKIPIFCWSDSSVVLSWLSCHPSKWKTFVANRVSEITTLVPTAQWRHVPGISNPADCASRGISADELIANQLWWQGPPWLRSGPQAWPNSIVVKEKEVKAELRSGAHTHVGDLKQNWRLPYEISSWPRLLRRTAYVLRFINNARHTLHKTEGISLSVEEITSARNFWIRSVQKEHFAQEFTDLQNKKTVSLKSKLAKLNPFLDKDNIIRLGGRLRHSALPYAERFPAILPKHRLTDLLIEQIHHQTLHGGLQLMLRTLRQDYWVLRARDAVKACIRSCIKCVRERAVIPTQMMGDLPSARVVRARPFTHTGVDYAGPLSVRIASGRGYRAHKCYIALFICLATRAIHIELVSDYSTEGFLAAFDRFISRRGLPLTVYSDNGTNFQGADRELTRQFKSVMNNPDVRNHLSSDGIAWNFIPPAAPHFGGIWEAGVKSVKHHLRRAMGSFTPTFEELTTLLCKIECCLNSRPIAPLLDDPEDFDALTPGHLLVGSHLKSVPSPSLLDVNENRLSRWQVVQQLAERFWKVWSSDYLNSLQQRSKWKVNRANILPGDFVLLRNQNLPPCKWDLGRVVECHPGSDNLTRVVTIKTAKSTYKRPIAQLCKLPVRT